MSQRVYELYRDVEMLNQFHLLLWHHFVHSRCGGYIETFLCEVGLRQGYTGYSSGYNAAMSFSSSLLQW